MRRAARTDFDFAFPGSDLPDALLDAPERAPNATPISPSRAVPRAAPQATLIPAPPEMPPVPLQLVGRSTTPRPVGPTLTPMHLTPRPPVASQPLRVKRRPAAQSRLSLPGLEASWFAEGTAQARRHALLGLDPSSQPDAPLPQFRRMPRVALIWALPPIGLAVAALATGILAGLI
jgi:hypothetical protein